MKKFFDAMYSDMGKKLCMVAKIMGVIWIVAGALTALAGLFTGEFMVFLICLLCGALGALLGIVSTWALYAFGQIVDDLHAIRTGGQRTPVSDELPDL